MFPHSLFFRRGILFVVLGALAGLPQGALAGGISFDMSHDFSILPGVVAAPLPVMTWKDFEHVYVSTPGYSDDIQWSPTAQSPGFSSGKPDWQDSTGRLWNLGASNPVPILTNQTSVGSGSFFDSHTLSASAGAGSATAMASLQVNPYSPGSALTGTLRTTGSAEADPGQPDALAYDFASSNLTVRGLTADWASGHIRWTPSISDPAYFIWPLPRVRRDPINVRILAADDTVLLEETLLDVTIGLTEPLAGQEGSYSWTGDVLAFTNALEGEFSVQADSSYIAAEDRGTALLVIHGGLVTFSEDTGVFDGLLPSVGTSGTFSVTFANLIEFDYVFSELGPTMEIDLGQGGLPDPATLSLLALGGLGLLARRRRR